MGYKLTRIAPTPSGYLHLGNVLSFAVTAALARDAGAEILLRIDDLDRDRVQPAYVEDIFETLRFMEIPWDRGPRDAVEFGAVFSQVRRLSLYREALAVLRDAGAVFGCRCSRAEVLRTSRDGGYPGTCLSLGVGLDEEGVSWRLRTDATYDLLDNARLPAEMRDFVVRKKDGFPAYQLSSVVDDLHYGVDLIVRGQDLWSSTLAQLYLSYPLGAASFRESRFYHHLLLTTNGEKLSKSAGSTSIQYLRQQGMDAASIYKMIAKAVVADGRLVDDTAIGGASRAAEASGVHDWRGLAALVLGADR